MSGDPFTGEFLVPDDSRFAVDIAQHLVPYYYCADHLAGKRVLEIGCGAGYGAHHMATTAGEVHGYDRNQSAIAWARERYQASNLRYSVEGFDAGPTPGEYDAVCNFQVLEHLERPEPFLAYLKSFLREGGRLFLTTPNRLTSAGENIYHVHEYEPKELESFLKQHFGTVTILGITGDGKYRDYQAARHRSMQRFLRYDPLRFRRLVPRPLLTWLYPRLARLVRRNIQGSLGPSELSIKPTDFNISPERLEVCDDLFAICDA